MTEFVITQAELEQALKDAAEGHHAAVAAGQDTDAGWPAWYASFIAKRFTTGEGLNGLQAGKALVRNTVLLMDGRRAKVNR